MGISTEKAILYMLLKEGEMPVQRMLKILRNFQKSDRSLRSALSRLKSRGYIESKRSGKNASYTLTDIGRATVALVREDKLKRQLPWEGNWHIVTFDIPERLRHMRDMLRLRLLALGYGRLHTSVMISPYDTNREVRKVLKEYGIEEYVELFSAKYEGSKNLKKLALKVWNLKRLEDQYKVFISQYKPELKAIKSEVKKKALDPSFAYLKKSELEEAYSRIALYDPDLPEEMLPRGWIGSKAKELYEEYRQVLTKIKSV